MTPSPFARALKVVKGWLPAVLGLALLLSGCSGQPSGGGQASGGSPASSGRSLTVAAASDLQTAFGEIGAAFEKDTGARVVFTFGSSGNLAKQIENGAPIDLFASASEDYVKQLASRGDVLEGTEKLYGIGKLVLVSSRASGVSVGSLADLSRPEVKHVAVANPDHAPYGVAAKQALESAGLWEQLKPKIAYGEDVRQTLQFVQTGNAEAGLVALSIANVPELSSIPLDGSLYSPLRQPIAVVKRSKQPELARQFVDFVCGERGREIMKRYGFALPGEG